MTDHESTDDAGLDAILAGWTTPPASLGLHERIVATARPRPRNPARGLWWGGVGLAGAVAGALVAAVLTSGATPPSPAGDTAHAAQATVFGDLDEDLES